MKAIVYEGINNVQVAKVRDPGLEKHDDIIVKVTSTAICGSDLHLVHGFVPNLTKGTPLGHETMGIVLEAGKAVTKVKPGDRVIVPFPVACGHCTYCDKGLYSQCDNSNEHGEAGNSVIVLGCGPVGLLTQKWAAYMGAGRIYAVDCVDYRLEHARKHNGVETVHLEAQDDIGAYLKELTHGGADCVIDCVGLDGKMSVVEKIESALKLQGGSKSAIEIASKSVRKGGNVTLVGVYGGPYNHFPLGEFFTRNITLRMGQCPAQQFVDPIMKLIRTGRFDATDIISHTLPLSEGEHAYSIFDKKTDNCIKVILKP
ncbi:alcohol dehydrogenase catalytic domain-containing protein [Lachnospiraceae bacterium 54-53]